jgi:hypothetical protein
VVLALVSQADRARARIENGKASWPRSTTGAEANYVEVPHKHRAAVMSTIHELGERGIVLCSVTQAARW